MGSATLFLKSWCVVVSHGESGCGRSCENRQLMRIESDSKERIRKQSADAVSADCSCRSNSGELPDSLAYAESIGYTEQELRSVSEDARATRGCGNPTALAELKEGEAVLDLGCGGGLDVFLAAQRVGRTGQAIGIDMTPEMIEKAKQNARKGDCANVEFKVAEMEKLPLADRSVDVVISNCVINHAPDKVAVFREAHRVLKAGGRMLVSDLVTTGELRENALRDAGSLWADWLAVASGRQEYLNAIEQAGFQSITILAESPFAMAEMNEALRGRIVSIQVKGCKLEGRPG